MSPLQKLPRGMLEAFSLKTNGEAPSTFGDQVVPVAELLDFYANDLLQTGGAAGVAGAFPLSVNLDVTAGGPSRLRAVGGFLSLGEAGDADAYYLGRVGVQIPSPAFPAIDLASVFIQAPTGGLASGTLLSVGGYLSRPLILPPGSRIVVTWASNDASVLHVPFARTLLEFLV